MADVTFPAKVIIEQETNAFGLPILTARIEVSDDIAALPLPAGPPGLDGDRGRPIAPFDKRGEVPNSASLPTGLGPLDAGKWWHNLATNGMEVWNGTEWKSSPDAVGGQGPIGPGNTLTPLPVRRDPRLRDAGAKIAGSTSDQTLEVTVPAGFKGAKGVDGASGAIREAADYDSNIGVTKHAVPAWNRSSAKYRPLPLPNGYGPYGLYTITPLASGSDVDRHLMGKLTMPAFDFPWRPFCLGSAEILTDGGFNTVQAAVRIGNENGQIVAVAQHGFGATQNFASMVTPFFGNKTLSPGSKVGVIAAGESVELVFLLERLKSTVKVGVNARTASLNVWAQPV